MNSLDWKIAFRNLLKKRVFALVNIGGLTLGLLCSLLIGTQVIHELSYDRFWPDSEHLYRLLVNQENNDLGNKVVMTPTAAKHWFDNNIGQIAVAARAQRTGSTVFKKEGEFVKEPLGFFADNSLFEIFPVPFVEGTAEGSLAQPTAIVISQSMKEKYFGDQPALGKAMELSTAYESGYGRYVVTGVYADFPSNAHFKPPYLFSIERLRQLQRRSIDAQWTNYNCLTYLKLLPDADPTQVDALIANAIVDNSTEYDMTGNSLSIQPVSDIHLQDFVTHGDLPGQVKRSSVMLLIGIGVLILSLVCINFFNLSTTRSLERAREVGVRKSFGASRGGLVRLYLVETAVQVLLSLVLALILFEVAGDVLAQIMGTSHSIGDMIAAFGQTSFILMIAGLMALVVLGAGLYPAVILSRFKPVDSLKGRIHLSQSKFNLGRSLLVIQFVITLSIGIVASIIYAQVDYMSHKHPGYDRHNVLGLFYFGEKKLEQIGEALKADPLIESVTYVDDNLINVFNSSTDYDWEGKPTDRTTRIYRLSVSDNFIEAMDIKLMEGRPFNPELKSDSSAVILNQSAARLMGIDDFTGFTSIKRGNELLQVIGLVEDFQTSDFRGENKPLLLYRSPERFFQAYVRINPVDLEAAVAAIKEKWQTFLPEVPFEYGFLDDRYEVLLAKDRQASERLLFFTVLSIVISFIGLFGMLRLRIQYRLKEMGIRKILGANLRQIMSAVSKEFGLYLMLAVLLGVPLAIWIGRSWLQGFVEHIPVSPMLPLLVVGLMSVIGLVTLIFSTVPLNRLNLVETLKDE